VGRSSWLSRGRRRLLGYVPRRDRPRGPVGGRFEPLLHERLRLARRSRWADRGVHGDDSGPSRAPRATEQRYWARGEHGVRRERADGRVRERGNPVLCRECLEARPRGFEALTFGSVESISRARRPHAATLARNPRAGASSHADRRPRLVRGERLTPGSATLAACTKGGARRGCGRGPPARPSCMDTSSQRVAAALSRMQERERLRSRAGGRSHLVQAERGRERSGMRSLLHDSRRHPARHTCFAASLTRPCRTRPPRRLLGRARHWVSPTAWKASRESELARATNAGGMRRGRRGCMSGKGHSRTCRSSIVERR